MIYRVPVVKRPEYTIWLENVKNEAVFIHCDVYKWNKSVKKDLKQKLLTLLSLQADPIFALHDKEDKKHKKFLDIFNFKYVKDIECLDNTLKEIYMVIGDSNG